MLFVLSSLLIAYRLTSHTTSVYHAYQIYLFIYLFPRGPFQVPASSFFKEGECHGVNYRVNTGSLPLTYKDTSMTVMTAPRVAGHRFCAGAPSEHMYMMFDIYIYIYIYIYAY